jgi:hypothetical protein
MKSAVCATEAIGSDPPSRGHMAAASPTIAVSGWAMALSQSCTTRGSRPVHRMFWDSQSPWPIHTRSGAEVSRSRTRRAASSTHSGPPTRLRSCPCSSRSGHSRRPGWSHPVHGGEGIRLGTAAGTGAEAIRRARRAAKGAGPATAGRGLPPGTSVSAVTVIPCTRVATVSGSGHGKPTRASAAWTCRQPAIRGSKGRAFTTARRPLDNSTPTTSERYPDRKSTRSNGAPR